MAAAPEQQQQQQPPQNLKDLYGQVDESTIIVGDIRIPLSEMSPTCRISPINGYPWHPKTILPHSDRTHILLKLTWNIHQDRAHSSA